MPPRTPEQEEDLVEIKEILSQKTWTIWKNVNKNISHWEISSRNAAFLIKEDLKAYLKNPEVFL